METKGEQLGSTNINRREALSRFLLGTAGFLVSCSPLNILGAKSTLTSKQTEIEILGAFMETIVPGLDVNHPGLTAVFYDKYYRFTKFRKILVNDIINQTRKLFSVNSFETLQREGREKIVQHVLNVGGIMKKVYSGAIYLTQITAYAGLYNRNYSSPIIDFKAEYSFEPTSYPNYKDFLGDNQTIDGNYS